MINNSKFYSILFMLLIFYSSCERNRKNDQQAKQKDSKETNQKLHSSVDMNSSSDTEFISKIACANKAEIEFGQAAVSKASNSDVKAFAQQMVKEHTQAQNDLKKLASSKNITLPDTIDAEHKALKKKTMSLSGSDFDEAYMQAQIDDHKKVLQEFQTEIKTGKDKEIVSYANKYVHHIQMHLDKAKSIEEAVSKNSSK